MAVGLGGRQRPEAGDCRAGRWRRGTVCPSFPSFFFGGGIPGLLQSRRARGVGVGKDVGLSSGFCFFGFSQGVLGAAAGNLKRLI